jgi:hypothetical protein
LWKVIVLLLLPQGGSRSLFDASIVFEGVKARRFRQRQRSLSWLSTIAKVPEAVMIPTQIQHQSRHPVFLGTMVEPRIGFKEAIAHSSIQVKSMNS